MLLYETLTVWDAFSKSNLMTNIWIAFVWLKQIISCTAHKLSRDWSSFVYSILSWWAFAIFSSTIMPAALQKFWKCSWANFWSSSLIMHSCIQHQSSTGMLNLSIIFLLSLIHTSCIIERYHIFSSTLGLFQFIVRKVKLLIHIRWI